jgi:sec-independent protein translocase protein TatA
MGIGGISIWQLLIILVIILVLFGTKRLRNIGSDLGGAIRGFRKAVKDEDIVDAEEVVEKKSLPEQGVRTDKAGHTVTNQPVSTTNDTHNKPSNLS